MITQSLKIIPSISTATIKIITNGYSRDDIAILTSKQWMVWYQSIFREASKDRLIQSKVRLNFLGHVNDLPVYESAFAVTNQDLYVVTTDCRLGFGLNSKGYQWELCPNDIEDLFQHV